MKNNKNSIKAIIFTIIFFLFIFFISLFKGITLYDFKTDNFNIKQLYVKIEKKPILHINGLKLFNKKNYTKQDINLHKSIFLLIKFFNFFQKIKINNLSYGKIKIKNIIYQNKILYLNSNFFTLKAVVNPDIKNCYINIINLKIPTLKINIKNSILNFKFLQNKIIINSNIYLNGNLIYLNGYLQNNNLNLKLSAKNIKNLNYKTVKIQKINNFLLKININLKTLKLYSNLKISHIKLKYDKIPLILNNIVIKQNKNIKTVIKEIFIPKFNILQKIKIENISLTYEPKYTFLTLDNKFAVCKYKDFNISAFHNNLIFSNIKNFNFKNHIININSKKYSLSLHKNLLSVLNGNVNYSINNSKFKTAKIVLRSKNIKGNIKTLFTKLIQGSVYKFPFKAIHNRVNIAHKSIKIKKITYNHININNFYLLYNKYARFTSASLFNKNIKEILHHFLKINIPLIQTGGYNDINTTINLNKQISFNTKINVKTSLFDLAGFNLYVPNAFIKINENNLTFKTKNSALNLAKNIILKYSGNGLVSFKQKNMILKGIINSFKINNVITLKNYKEYVDINFTAATLKAKNSSLLIDFNKKQLIISPLKNILPYTEFYTFVKDGILLITFNKKIHIMSYLMTKLPILYIHSNIPIRNKKSYTKTNLIKKLFLNITIDKKNTTIFNKNVFITNYKNHVYAQINNMDLNLFPLEKLLLDNNNTKNDLNYSIKIDTTDSNIIYKTHKFLSQKATFSYKNDNIKFKSFYKHSSVYGYTKQQYFLLEGKNFNIETFNTFLPKFDFFKQINCDFVMVKSPDDFYTGNIYIKHAVIKQLRSLNNILAFINTIPSILSLSSPGFSSKGYKIKKGFINYLLYKKILYFKQAKIYGNNIDFFAKGYIDLNRQYIFLKVTANLKVKLNKIPIIGKGLSYLFFGKDGSLDIKMIVKGNLNNPKVKEDLGKDILMTPFTLFKRVLTLPFHIF